MKIAGAFVRDSMKRTFVAVFFLLLLNCKSVYRSSNSGAFVLVNQSAKEIEFIWITPEGEFYPTAKSISVKNGQVYELKGLDEGIYDIAIDFKGEYNSFNSKKDKSLCLRIKKGETTSWFVNQDGVVVTN